jgi:hypothetical protein
MYDDYKCKWDAHPEKCEKHDLHLDTKKECTACKLTPENQETVLISICGPDTVTIPPGVTWAQWNNQKFRKLYEEEKAKNNPEKPKKKRSSKSSV